MNKTDDHRHKYNPSHEVWRGIFEFSSSCWLKRRKALAGLAAKQMIRNSFVI